MVDQVLDIIVRELDSYIKSVNGVDSSATEPIVELGNIAGCKLAGSLESGVEQKVVVSLVNIAEESTLKNKMPGQQRGGGTFYEEYPPVHVNLYLLFTANFEKYNKAISHLFRVMEFFQGRKEFGLSDALFPAEHINEVNNLDPEDKILVELHTLNFEQINDLWGSLGGRQMPFVLYRARLIPIRMQRQTGRAGVITEIGVTI